MSMQNAILNNKLLLYVKPLAEERKDGPTITLTCDDKGWADGNLDLRWRWPWCRYLWPWPVMKRGWVGWKEEWWRGLSRPCRRQEGGIAKEDGDDGWSLCREEEDLGPRKLQDAYTLTETGLVRGWRPRDATVPTQGCRGRRIADGPGTIAASAPPSKEVHLDKREREKQWGCGLMNMSAGPPVQKRSNEGVD